MHCNLIVFVCLFAYAFADPAIEAQRAFKQVVNSNECLKKCMVPVQESNLELSVFKRSNYSDYFLNLDQTCELIKDTRHCVDQCQVNSNPFALISMNIICEERSRQDVKLLEQCFNNLGAQVSQQCQQICGNHDELSDQLHLSTSTLKPEDKSSLEMINKKTNDACGVLKCNARCSVDQFNRQCGQLKNGQMAGNLIRELVERVLASHQMDLRVFGVLETMQKNSQPECNYLHTPGVLFDQIKDLVSQQVIRNTQQGQQQIQQQQITPEQQSRSELNQLYVRILKKQLQVLDKQLEIMNRQEKKLDNEMPSSFVQPIPNDF